VSAVVPAGKPPLGQVWGDLALALPEGAPAAWRDVLSGEEVAAEGGALPAAHLFARLPVALLVAG
jgi:maltooligosyltrehalose synthase